jgi:hypothetical protein
MRFLVPQGELQALAPSAPTAGRCRRVALAMEAGAALRQALDSPAILEQAALLHHTPSVVLGRSSTDRPLHDLFPGGTQRADSPRNKPLPEKLTAVLNDCRAFPRSGTDRKVRTMSHILAICNLVDEQIELLPFEPKPIEACLGVGESEVNSPLLWPRPDIARPEMLRTVTCFLYSSVNFPPWD